jgi:hypothetical protein
MNIVRVVCANPRCQKVMRIRLAQAGKRIRCPSCQVSLIAPQVPGGGGATLDDNAEDADDYAEDAPRPLWMTLAFYGGVLVWVLSLVVLALTFEVWRVVDDVAVNKGSRAELLASASWKVVVPKGKQSAKTVTVPAWAAPNAVWTFHESGWAETGPLMDNRNRYDREQTNVFRVWKRWTVDDDDKLTMTFKDEEPWTFKVVDQPNDKLQLVSDREDMIPLMLEKVVPVETFPGWRLVFYGGVMLPMVVTVLLSWLISREMFHSGCLRFALAWPLTVLVGLALGAGAGFLMDMLNDHSLAVLPYSHVVLPYWMLLAFVQGILCLGMGLWLAVMSCLRPT